MRTVSFRNNELLSQFITDLYLLFEGVRALGGFDIVSRKTLFVMLREYLHIPASVNSYGTQLRKRYQRFILPCEDKLATTVDRAYNSIGMMSDSLDFLKARGVDVDSADSIPGIVLVSNTGHRINMNQSEDDFPEATMAAIKARMSSNFLEGQELTHELFAEFRPNMAQLDLRNHILRMWYRNIRVRLTVLDALRDVPQRFQKLGIAVFTFLELSGNINFGALPVDTPFAALHSNGPMAKSNIVVIGAGVAGLCAARHLMSFGVNVTILEARSRAGGRAFTDSENFSAPVDLGAMVITGVNQNPVCVLAQQVKANLIYAGNDCPLFDVNGEWVTPEADQLAEQEFNAILDATALYRTRKNSRADIDCMSLGEAFQRALELRARKRMAQRYKEGLISPGSTTLNGRRRSDSVYLRLRSKDGLRSSSNVKHTRFGRATKVIQKEFSERSKGALRNRESTDNVFSSEEKRDNELLSRLLRWHIANLEYGCAADISNVSLKHWDQDDPYGFSGEHALLSSGFNVLLNGLLDTVAANIEYDSFVTHVCRVRRQRGRTESPAGKFRSDLVVIRYLRHGTLNEVAFDAAIVTVPLGVLKEGTPKFFPCLPPDKVDAIQRLGNGGLVKIVMEFPEAFWIKKNMFGALRDIAASRGEYFLFWNLHRCTGKAILVSLVSEPCVTKVESMTDRQVVRAAMQVLRTCYRTAPYPLRYCVTRWSSDPLARGAYSYIPVGSSGEDYDKLAASVGETLFFAGEHTCRSNPTTTASALISGYREAHNVLKVLGLHNSVKEYYTSCFTETTDGPRHGLRRKNASRRFKTPVQRGVSEIALLPRTERSRPSQEEENKGTSSDRDSSENDIMRNMCSLPDDTSKLTLAPSGRRGKRIDNAGRSLFRCSLP